MNEAKLYLSAPGGPGVLAWWAAQYALSKAAHEQTIGIGL